MDLSEYRLLSSNPKKLEEYSRFCLGNLDIIAGPDLKEVDGTADDVIIYKSLAAGSKTIVEDSILNVDGKAYVDSKFRINAVNDWVGLKACWEVSIGMNTGDEIRIYKGKKEGRIVPARGSGADYDPYFLIISEGKTYAELEAKGLKDIYSARRFAALNLVADSPHLVLPVETIPAWNGEYQRE